jgi:hypothetical protein
MVARGGKTGVPREKSDPLPLFPLKFPHVMGLGLNVGLRGVLVTSDMEFRTSSYIIAIFNFIMHEKCARVS